MTTILGWLAEWWRSNVSVEVSLTLAVTALLYIVSASARKRWQLDGAFEQAIDVPLQLMAVAIAFVLSRILKDVDPAPVAASFVVSAMFAAGVVDVLSVSARENRIARNFKSAVALVVIEIAISFGALVVSIGLLQVSS
ncbi:MAG: hypothetical protein WCI61_05000 [Chloroflexota bacterium]